MSKQSLLLALAGVTVLAFAVSFALGVANRRQQPARRTGVAGVTEPQLSARIEVFNATNTSGLARLATDQLRRAGYDVVDFGNATRRSEYSVVLDRLGREDVARAIARSLRIDSVRTAIDSTRYVEATVLIGRDWKPRN